MIIPSTLKHGDKIYLLSTARKISLPEIEFAIKTFSDWGLEVVVGKTIGAENFQFAGNDELRTQDFQTALDDENIKAIICCRGGYGTVRIIDELDYRKFLKKPKWICGFSDITVLHSHLLAVYDCASLHCTMPLCFPGNTIESIESFRKVLFGEKLNYEIPSHEKNREGNANGIICGGNLSLIYNMSGTASDLNTDGKILFIEDIDEYLYQFDRMIQWLRRSGKLENLAGLVVGHLSQMKNLDEANPFGRLAENIISEAISFHNYPVMFGFPAGHENDNRAIIIGETATISVQSSGSSISF